jgi:hypothetical protein
VWLLVLCCRGRCVSGRAGAVGENGVNSETYKLSVSLGFLDFEDFSGNYPPSLKFVTIDPLHINID